MVFIKTHSEMTLEELKELKEKIRVAMLNYEIVLSRERRFLIEIYAERTFQMAISNHLTKIEMHEKAALQMRKELADVIDFINLRQSQEG